MFYRVAADMVVVIHFIWIVFLVFGAFLGLYRKSFMIIHVVGLSFAIIIQLFGWYCPLTYIEVWLRHQHDPSLTYSGSFIVHYIERIVYLQIPRSSILALTLLVVILNALIYIRKR